MIRLFETQHGTGVATSWIKRLLGGILALLALSVSLWSTYHYSYKAGVQKGVDAYHMMCYTYGGFIVDERTGTVVACSPMTEIPEPERKKFLDNRKET